MDALHDKLVYQDQIKHFTMNLFLCGGGSQHRYVAKSCAEQKQQQHYYECPSLMSSSNNPTKSLRIQESKDTKNVTESAPLLYFHQSDDCSEPKKDQHYSGGSSSDSTETTADGSTSVEDNDDVVSTESFLQDNTKPHVTFGDIQIRMYPMTIGDNPSCSMGPPVQLDWEYEEFLPMDLQAYETARSYHDARYHEQLLLSAKRRNKILQRAGFTFQQLCRAQRAVLRVRRERTLTTYLDCPQYSGGVLIELPSDGTVDEDLAPECTHCSKKNRRASEESCLCSENDIKKARSTSIIAPMSQETKDGVQEEDEEAAAEEKDNDEPFDIGVASSTLFKKQFRKALSRQLRCTNNIMDCKADLQVVGQQYDRQRPNLLRAQSL